MTITREAEMQRSLKEVTTLADELRLVSLNLTVAHAKLRLTDEAFQAVNAQVREMLDTAARTSEKAEELKRRAAGATQATQDGSELGDGLEQSLDRIKELAEKIIVTVTAIKRGRSIDQRL
ncbi:MAG: hypothetical protein ABIJ61_06245 [bacterium]